MRRKTKTLISGVTLGCVLMGVVALSIYLYFGQYKRTQIIKNYEILLDEYRTSAIVEVYRTAEALTKYDVISELDYEIVALPQNLYAEAILNTATPLVGLAVNHDLPKGTIIHSNMVYARENLPNDLRIYEISSLLTQLSLKKGDDIDIRISFPSGMDYVVLSKKTLIEKSLVQAENDLKEICLLHLNADEILRLSSALVDAYMHEGTYLYTTIYVSGESQEAAEVTYPANEDVQRLIAQDPNIVEKAQVALEAQKRLELSASLSHMPNDSKRVIPKKSLSKSTVESDEMTKEDKSQIFEDENDLNKGE